MAAWRSLLKALRANLAASELVPEVRVSSSMRRAARARRAAALAQTNDAMAQTIPAAANHGWGRKLSNPLVPAPTSAKICANGGGPGTGIGRRLLLRCSRALGSGTYGQLEGPGRGRQPPRSAP